MVHVEQQHCPGPMGVVALLWTQDHKSRFEHKILTQIKLSLTMVSDQSIQFGVLFWLRQPEKMIAGKPEHKMIGNALCTLFSTCAVNGAQYFVPGDDPAECLLCGIGIKIS